MINSGERRCGQPILRLQSGSLLMPKRVPFDDRKFKEGWLQALIETSPEVLPVSEIEPVFAPLVSIGREVPTRVGALDNLFISPQGYLTIAETKLWRNPEARRQVVGQIIDYASELSQWTYDDLEREVKKYNQKCRNHNSGLLETMRLHWPEIQESSEATVIDGIMRNMRRGRFLLLLVGDGIREDVERMADFLTRTPQMHFTLALVELQVYEVDIAGDQSILVVPQLVTRTREITRAVVRVEGESLRLSIDAGEDDGKVRVRLTEDDYFGGLKRSVQEEDVAFAQRIKEDVQQRFGCVIDWGVGSFIVKLPDPGGSGEKLTLFVVGRDGKVWVGWLATQLEKLGVPSEIALDFVKKSAQLFPGCKVSRKDPQIWWNTPSLGQVRERYGDFLYLVQEVINKIKDASAGIATQEKINQNRRPDAGVISS